MQEKEQTNALGIPFSKCHCFDQNNVCHFCGIKGEIPEYRPCTRIMEPINGYINYFTILISQR
jgi:hypothetical protein